MTLKAATEEDLAARRDVIWLEQISQNRDKRAMEALYQAYKSRLIPFMHRMTTDKGLIEEVYNDVMLTVWNKASQFNGESKVSSWIFSIAYRACLKILQKQKVRRGLFDIFTQNTLNELEQEDQSESDHSQLENAIKELPAKHKIVIELSYFQGYSIEEISQIADCPANTVKTRLHHARHKIRQYMADKG